jgi:hypothetical protein
MTTSVDGSLGIIFPDNSIQSSASHLTPATISATGNIQGQFIYGNGFYMTGIDTLADVQSYLPTYTGNLNSLQGDVTTTTNINAGGGINGQTVYAMNQINAGGNISTSGNVIGGNVIATYQALGSPLALTGYSADGNVNTVTFATQASPPFNVGSTIFVSLAGIPEISGNWIVSACDTSSVTQVSAIQPVETFVSGTVSPYVTEGSVTTTDLSASGNVTATYFIGDGSELSNINVGNITGLYSNANVANYLPTYSGNVGAGNINTVNLYGTGVISASGNIRGSNINTAGNLSASGNLLVGGVSSDLIPTANVTYNLGNATNQWKSLYVSNNTIYINNVAVTIGAGNVLQVAGANVVTSTGNTTNVTTLVVSGNANVGNLSSSGSVVASSLTGTITTASQTNITSVGTLTALSVTGNATAGNISATNITGTLATASQPNITSVGTLTSLNTSGSVSAAGNVTGNNFTFNGNGNILGNLNVQGNITFIGSNVIVTNDLYIELANNQSTLANVNGAGLVVGNTGTASLVTWTYSAGANAWQSNVGIVSSGAISAVGNVTGQYLIGNGAFITGSIGNGSSNVNGANGSFSGSVSAGSVSTSGNVTAAGISASGTVTASSLTGTITTASQTNITSVGTLTALSVSGNATAGNISATNITGTLATASQPNITSVGTLTSLAVTGNATAGNISATNITGTLATASQPNITSVGTLTALSVSGNATAGNISATNITGTITTASQTNITSVGTLTSLNTSGAVSAVGNVTGNYFIGNGALLTNINAANIVGAYGNANVANYLPTYSGAITASSVSASGTVTGASLTGTITTATQPNITSVGTLTSLSVSGNITSGNVSATNITGTITTASQPNITSVGTLTSLSVTGNATVGNISATNLTGTAVSVTGSITAVSADFGTGSVSLGGIVNNNANGVGNIGSSSTYFNTVFAQSTSALYADLAEHYLADAHYEPGTVVKFGGVNEVTIANQDSDKRVAGVISTNPSYVMNSGLDGEFVAVVALTGRVPCKVIGNVSKGDLMVTAVNGFARAEENPTMGTVIGKALQDFTGESGVIEVVVGRL